MTEIEKEAFLIDQKSERIGRELAEVLLERGAREILNEIYSLPAAGPDGPA